MLFDINEKVLKYYNLISFCLLLLSAFIQNLVNLWHSYRLGNKFNNRKVKKWKNFNFETIFSKNVQVGDLILISKGEEVPADVILMDCKGGKNTLFDESRNLGSKEYVEKIPVDSFKVLKELDHNEIFYSLTRIESILVTLPNISLKKFKGKIRYRGDPKTYLTGVNSLVLGGSVLVSSEWVLGLVVYTGMETKYWMNSKSTLKTKIPKMTVTINKIFTLNFLIILFLVVICTIAAYFQDQLQKNLIQESIVWYIIIYSNLISISYFVVLKLSRILSAFVMMLKNKSFSISPMSLEELGRVEYLIINKEDLIKHKNMKISSVFLKDLTFFRQDGIKKHKNIGNNENLIKSAGLTSAELKYMGFDNLKDYCFNHDFSEQQDFFYCALFTSLSHFPDLQKPTRENEKILKLWKSIGLVIEQKSNEFFVVSFNKIRVDCLVIAYFKNSQKTFVLVTDTSQSKATLYLKSDKKLHNYSGEEGYPSVFESNEYLARYKTHFFYQVSIEREALEQFMYDYSIVSKSNINSNGKLLSLFESYSENTQFLGCINFQYKYHKSIRKTLDALQNIGIKTWMG
jgi:magnesium-transporting ATPase (P-type)